MPSSWACSPSPSGIDERRELFAARDRLGIKPLYYRVLADGIAFASELKALLVLGTPPIDKSAVRDFLVHGYVPAPKTIYQGIAKLPAGHCLNWRDGALKVERYWEPSLQLRLREREASRAQLDALLRVVIPEHTLSDVPVGVFLSGGMDSALTAYYLGRPRTFTLDFAADRALRGGCGARPRRAPGHAPYGHEYRQRRLEYGARHHAAPVR